MMAKDVVISADDSFEHLQEKLKTFTLRSIVVVQVRFVRRGKKKGREGRSIIYTFAKGI